MTDLLLSPGHASIDDLKQVIDNPQCRIQLTRECKPAVDKAAAVVDNVVNAEAAVYGVNTGFGKLASVRIESRDSATLQRNLILSHCAGVGDATDPSIVRLMMVLKLLSLGRGASGVRWQLIETIELVLNAGIIPVVPSQGSVGASGDLAPLAHFSAVLMGEGEAYYQGKCLPSTDALQAAEVEPIELIAKEIMGSTAPLQPAIHELRGHQGQIDVAASMRALMQGSVIRESHREEDTRVQDPYCIRCQPQVTGACIGLLRYAAVRVTFTPSRLHLQLTRLPWLLPKLAQLRSVASR